MNLIKALDLVLALAEQNLIEDEIVNDEPELVRERERQEEAISKVISLKMSLEER